MDESAPDRMAGACRGCTGARRRRLALPARIAAADHKEVIVFFDEFQEIASPQQPYGDPDRLTKRMRAIFQRSTGVSYLFAGSLEHLMRDLFTPSQRALHQMPRGAVRRALEALRDAAIIESRGRGDWRFASPLLRRYLAGIGPFE
jgi:DNA-binding transcriptional ArsR family regulator